MITYANNPPQFSSYLKYLQNRICTVADSFRVADDFGKLRCQLTYFNRPIFGWKGSYVVCNVSFLNRFPPLYPPILRLVLRRRSALTGAPRAPRRRTASSVLWLWTRATPSTSSRGRCTRSLPSPSLTSSSRGSGGCREYTWSAPLPIFP